jgi:alpha-D-ribose 1-methylphosphonate 5-triphosphate synthase subunit PhnH
MLAGLADPVLDSQRIFRALLDAMANPGRIVELPGPESGMPPVHAAAAAVCLALLDLDTSVWLDERAARGGMAEFVRFHCGCQIVAAPEQARFALVLDTDAMPALARFDAGTDEFPDRSATVIVQTRGFSAGSGRRLTGAGIAGEARLDVSGLTAAFWRALDANHALFPRGVDVLLTDGARLVALPRTTKVED